ncbi:MAG: DUF5689 domain-containing protein [Flavobacteriales bacterium]
MTLQGMLVKLTNVEFAASDTALTFADAIHQTSASRTIEDCSNNTVIARNSGFSDYAAQPIPNGKGSLVATVGQFGNTMQLNLRSRAEVDMNGLRCGQGPITCDPVASINEHFDAVTNNATITPAQVPCWGNTQTDGSRAWRGRADGANMCAEAAPISFDATSVEWLVTAPISFHSGMTLSFRSAQLNWVHDGLTVWVSTDYTTAVATATWTQVSGPTIAGSADASAAWVNSGNITLDSALPAGYHGNFVIAFKYSGSGTDTGHNTIYRIDDVVVN